MEQMLQTTPPGAPYDGLLGEQPEDIKRGATSFNAAESDVIFNWLGLAVDPEFKGNRQQEVETALDSLQALTGAERQDIINEFWCRL